MHTKDYLLNKKVVIFQPVDGYRASTDAVLLSATVNKIKKGDTILDVGSGTGAISLCLAERFKDVKIAGLEIQTELVELSNLSAAENGFADYLNFVNVDIKNCKIKESFNHVVTNPPYSEKDMPSPNESKKTAHNHQDFSLKEWLNFCIKRLKPKGYLYTINRAENITEIISIIHGKLGDINIIPLYSKEGQDAKRVIVVGRRDSSAPTKITQGLVIHNSNGEYTIDAEKILRLGESI